MPPLSDKLVTAQPFIAFLADLEVLGVRPVASGGLRYAVVAARSNPRSWLLPLDNRRAASSGLEMLQPITVAAKLAKSAMRGLTRFGPHGILGCGHLRLSGLPKLDGIFGEQLAHVAYFTGTDGPHRKTALQVMNARGKILGYAKLSRAAHLRPYIQNEAMVLDKLSELRLRSADVPKVLSFCDDPTLTLLATDSSKSRAHSTPRVPGPHHLQFLQELRAKTERVGAASTLDDLSKKMASLGALAGEEWNRRIVRAITALRPLSETIPVCLTHGDFTPWNTFMQDDRLYVFDWEYANETWPVGFDLAHFFLATKTPSQQVDSLPALIDALASMHFDGNRPAACHALLLSLVCHAVFYLCRLVEVNGPLSDWPECTSRAEMIDALLANRETGA